MPDIDEGKSERASTSKSLKSDINESEQLVTLISTENVQVSEKDISNEKEKSHEDRELTDVAADITKEALSDSYFQCIGKLKFATVIHFESSFAEVAAICNTVFLTYECSYENLLGGGGHNVSVCRQKGVSQGVVV